MRTQLFILSLLLTIGLAACQSSNLVLEKQAKVSSDNLEAFDGRLRYKLNAPDFICALDKKLLEISALSFDDKSKSLLAVNDEKAMIYKLKAADCSIIKDYDFGKKGDYEGIELVGDEVYVLKANGNIYRTTMKVNEVTQEYKTALKTINDVEGLGYNSMTNKLILACKGTAALEGQDKLKATKAFYSFDLEKMSLDAIPNFTITDEELFSFYYKMPFEKKSVSSDKKLKERLKSFSPSAIAWHPIEKRYYVLSSVGKLLIVVDKKGKIKEVEFLDNNIHQQPEGICFANDGTMFISNEGKGLVAKIMKYAYPIKS